MIIGTSDHGKSSIHRALKWLIENKAPKGDFDNDDMPKGGSVSASIKFDDGTQVTRFRNKKINGYQILGEEKPLEATRGSVPTEISKLTRLNASNIQDQGQQYFLFQESPGKVAKYFNELVGLQLIDNVREISDSKIRETNANVLTYETEIKELEEELTKFDDLPILEKHLELAQKHSTSLKQFDDSVEELSGLLEEFQDIQDQLDETLDTDSIEKLFKEADKKEGELKELNESIALLSELIEEHEEIDQKMVKVKKDITEIEKEFDVLVKAHENCPLCGQLIKEPILGIVRKVST